MNSGLKNTVFVSVITAKSGLADAALRRWSCEADRRSWPRHNSLVSRALLRGLLAEITAVPAEDWRFAVDRTGRPRVCGGENLAPSISFSDSGGWVGFALAFAGEVGVDIETARRPRDLVGMAAMAFGPKEQLRARSEGAPGFYRLWVLREAIAKATGRGLAEAMDGRDRADLGPDEGTWWSVLDNQEWLLSHTRPQTGLSVGLALKRRKPTSGEGPVTVKWWQP
jgi:4'-phosphopantetheinyl transferase